MAMTLRLPPDVDRALTKRATRERRSKTELAIEAIRRDNERAELSISDVLDDLVDEQADILERLK